MTKRSASKQRKPPVYFVDRDFGPTETCEVVRILRAGGLTVEPHDSHFPDKAPSDPEWLAFVGVRRWIGLSADRQMSLSDLAIRSLMTFNARAFVCIGAGKHGYSKMARNVVNSRHRMGRFIHKYRREPFIARLYMAPQDDFERGRAGLVDMCLTHSEWVAAGYRRPRRER